MIQQCNTYNFKGLINIDRIIVVASMEKLQSVQYISILSKDSVSSIDTLIFTVNNQFMNAISFCTPAGAFSKD